MDRLEDRCTPSLFASSGGTVYELNEQSGAVIRSFTPFEKEARDVPLFISQDTDTLYIGAGVGGGPRLIAVTQSSFAEKWSVFVGDPNSRTGVSVSALPQPSQPITAGEGWTVWIDGDISKEAFNRVADILAPLNLKITTDYPDSLRPGEYTTVILHDQGNVGWRPSALGTANQAVRNDSLYQPTMAYAPNYSAEVIAHEVVHTIQPLNYPPHSTNTADLMYPYLTGGINIPDVEVLNASISRLQDGWRFGIILSNTNGTFSYGDIDLTP